MDEFTSRLAAAFGFLRSLAIYQNPLLLWRWRRFYSAILRPGVLAFDVGAHLGTRARAMRAAGARVVAVEPQAPFSAFLRLTLPRDITVLDVALGREVTQGTMAVSSRHPTVSSLSAEFVAAGETAAGFEHVRWDRHQAVKVLTLDALIARFGMPDYIKIDVEGGEMTVLQGLSHPVPMISVEYLPAMPQLARDLIDRMHAMGFERFNIVRGEGGAFLWADWQGREATVAWLKALDANAKSGDLFAARAG
ncbi:MAG: FkbM family methyltransferase [Pseudomonadota bacterium]